jgi:hypothetical protein
MRKFEVCYLVAQLEDDQVTYKDQRKRKELAKAKKGVDIILACARQAPLTLRRLGQWLEQSEEARGAVGGDQRSARETVRGRPESPGL